MKRKHIAVVALPAALILFFSLLFLLSPAKTYSLTERRLLAQKPTPSAQSLLSGDYMSQFEAYSLDAFPLRDSLRTVKAETLRSVFRRKDSRGFYLENGYLSRLEYPANIAKWDASAQKIAEIRDTYLASVPCRVYLSVIPDKNYYLAPLGGYPVMDCDARIAALRDSLPFVSYIDISPTLSLSSFYKTDQHWRQEALLPTAQALADGLGVKIPADYTENTLPIPFYGAYVGQSALKIAPDTIKYLTSPVLSSCTVTSYDTGEPTPAFVYDMEKAQGRDPYELFLSGSDALLTIENPSAPEKRELVVFRDSFASSLVPLLVPAYSKITLVDLRYIRSDLIGNYVNFENVDVLFLSSTRILNNGIST